MCKYGVLEVSFGTSHGISSLGLVPSSSPDLPSSNPDVSSSNPDLPRLLSATGPLVPEMECPIDRWVPGRSGLVDYMDPLPSLQRGRACLARPFWKHFWMNFLTSSWDLFFPDFGTNLNPTCLPTWPQNPPKIVPRGLQISSQLASYSRYPF